MIAQQQEVEEFDHHYQTSVTDPLAFVRRHFQKMVCTRVERLASLVDFHKTETQLSFIFCTEAWPVSADQWPLNGEPEAIHGRRQPGYALAFMTCDCLRNNDRAL